MRIVHVTDVHAPGLGGIERQIAMLVREQRAVGHDVSVVTCHPGAADPAGARVATSLPGGRVDVVHGHLSVWSPFTLRTTARAARRGAPVVLTVHSLWQGPQVMRALLALSGGGPRGATWSAVSQVAVDRVRKVLPDVGQVHVVPNGVDVGWWRGPDAAEPANPTVHAVMVNRLAMRKRVGPLVRKLGGWTPDVRLTIVGDGPRRRGIESAIAAHDLGERVVLTRALRPEQIRAVLRTADVFLAPSRLESFGIAALEARAAGVPVIGFAGTGVADLIRDGVDGAVVRTDDQMLYELHRLTLDHARLDGWRHEARSTLPPFDLTASCHAVERLYAVGISRTGSSLGPRRESSPAVPIR